jgi:multidrug efflux pump subunit AcrB
VIFTPYLGVKLLPANSSKHAQADPHAIYETRAYNVLRRVVAFCVRWRGTTVLVTIAVFVASIAAFGRVQQQFFPLSERPELFFQMRLPEGTAIGVTTEVAKQAERISAMIPILRPPRPISAKGRHASGSGSIRSFRMKPSRRSLSSPKTLRRVSA